jgi:hypothetical protein
LTFAELDENEVELEDFNACEQDFQAFSHQVYDVQFGLGKPFV